MAHEGRGDGPAPIISAQIITIESGPEGAQTIAKIVNGDFWRVLEPGPVAFRFSQPKRRRADPPRIERRSCRAEGPRENRQICRGISRQAGPRCEESP